MTDIDRWREAYPKLVQKYGPVRWMESDGRVCVLVRGKAVPWCWILYVSRDERSEDDYNPPLFIIEAILEKWLREKLGHRSDIQLHDAEALIAAAIREDET